MPSHQLAEVDRPARALISKTLAFGSAASVEWCCPVPEFNSNRSVSVFWGVGDFLVFGNWPLFSIISVRK